MIRMREQLQKFSTTKAFRLAVHGGAATLFSACFALAVDRDPERRKIEENVLAGAIALYSIVLGPTAATAANARAAIARRARKAQKPSETPFDF